MSGSNENTITFPLKGNEYTFNLKLIKSKGRMTYEYNPLHNYRKAGKIQDFNTTQLDYDIKHPVEINCQPSYDGTVNLLLTDGNSTPKLINSRFTVKENNTYEVIDRTGNSDTNLYDEEQFDADSSLTKQFISIPKLVFNGTAEGGNLKVGNYTFYVKYCDADENETDVVAESGIVSCFIGTIPESVKGGYKDENSNKIVSLTLTNLDSNYDYIKISYVRSTSDVDLNSYNLAYNIIQKFPISGERCTIYINGQEAVEDTTVESLNVRYFVPQTIKTATQCSNRLFIGNVTTSTVDQEDLRDISLRIYPSIVQNDAESFIGNLNERYVDISTSKNPNMYYNAKNIYYRVGYWNEEMYRFGIVYIMGNGTLSPVFNVSGKSSLSASETNPYPLDLFPILSDNKRQYLTISETTYSVAGTQWNSKGVCRLNVTPQNSFEVLGIKFNMPQLVIEYLKDKVKGFFFVRQKRIPTKVALMYLMPHDSYSGLPLLNNNAIYKRVSYESFLTKDRILNNVYLAHLRDGSAEPSTTSFVGICPEAELWQSYYNQLLTGVLYTIKESANNTSSNALIRDSHYDRHYYAQTNDLNNSTTLHTAYIGSIPDSAPLIAFNNTRFRAIAGEATDGSKFQYIGYKNKDDKATNLVRGNWGPYVGVSTNYQGLSYGKYYDIIAQGFALNNLEKEIKVRCEDSSEYMAIGDRYLINQLSSDFTILNETYSIAQYRGDCYICLFTHRLNRNFQDPSAPINDDILKADSWKDNYDANDATKRANINRGDVNAVSLGSWVTIKVYASRNISLRTEDLSYPTEQGINGHARGFYPYQTMSVDGCYKIPESAIMNAGYGVTLGQRWNYTLPEAPYYKNIFQTRIYYSDIAVNDAFKNGYRVFRENNYRDYPILYGGLMKMVTCKSYIIAIFEHGVCLLPVNERTLTAESAGGSIFINTNNVLPENPSSIISDMYGTQWPESVVQTPRGIYGVDTVAKKIWCISLTDLSLNCISDFKVQQFLNQNITLSEFTTTPIIGVRNVKSHYNAFKKDVMFTFYNPTQGYEETAWNLCYNEGTTKFVTFYSWIPSYSENIDNMFFSFDRDTSKHISKLAISTTNNATSDYITVANPIINDKENALSWKTTLSYKDLDTTEYTYSYSLESDPERNSEFFVINKPTDGELALALKNDDDKTEFLNRFSVSRPVLYITIKCIVQRIDKSGGTTYTPTEHIQTIVLTLKSIIERKALSTNFSLPHLFTYFWKHGQAGLQDIADKIKPTYWYGQQHPFEIEFVVNQQPSIHKIFNNLLIISNAAEPESFHYEVIGDAYDFAKDKKNMYFRLEATKCLYQNLGSDITYDHDYLKDNKVFERNDKSTIFPLTYYRQDSQDKVQDDYNFYNDVEMSWRKYNGFDRDYTHLSGAEIHYDTVTDQYSIQEHSKAVNMKDSKYGRLRGNMMYKEDRWDIQINSLVYSLKNEGETGENNDKMWYNKKYPPIAIIGALPNDIVNPEITPSGEGIAELQNSEIAYYSKESIANVDNNLRNNDGWSTRKEAKLRDKCMKVRIRYSGKLLAIITAVLTLYTQSYG